METSTVSKRSKFWVILVPAIFLVLACGAVAGFTLLGNNAGGKVLAQPLSEPLGGATAASFDIDVGTGNLTIDTLASGEQLLASGELEYLEGQDSPTATVDRNGGLYTLTLKASGGRQTGFQLPWSACNGETSWLIHLNSSLPADVTALSGGGNLQLNLAGMQLTSLVADTGGGNVDVVLPDGASDLNVSAKTGGGSVTLELGSGMTGSSTLTAASGAGSVVVRLPAGTAARIHASSGVGKLLIDPQFTKIDDHTYQSPDYGSAAGKVEITVESGAGDVTVTQMES